VEVNGNASKEEVPIDWPDLMYRHNQMLLMLRGARATFPELDALAPEDENGELFINIDTARVIIEAAFECMEHHVHWHRPKGGSHA